MSLLFAKEPIVVNKYLACAIGLNEAVVLQQVNYWVQKSTHEIDGRVWVYNSMSAWQEQFPFWSYDTVKRIFATLVKANLLICGNYNKSKMDKTKWYAINNERLGEIEQSIGAKCPNGEGQNAPLHEGDSAPMDWGNIHQPIPETTQETTTEITQETIVEITTEDIVVALPEWSGFLDMRESLSKKNKKPFTEHAKNLLLKKLIRFHEQGFDVQHILGQSIINNWQDLYEPKPQLGIPFKPSVKDIPAQYTQQETVSRL